MVQTNRERHKASVGMLLHPNDPFEKLWKTSYDSSNAAEMKFCRRNECSNDVDLLMVRTLRVVSRSRTIMDLGTSSSSTLGHVSAVAICKGPVPEATAGLRKVLDFLIGLLFQVSLYHICLGKA